MKKMSKVVTGLAAMAMVVSLVLPAKAEEYQYKFTLSAGKQGTVTVEEGSLPVLFTEDAKVTFAQDAVTDDVSSNNPQGGTVTVTSGNTTLVKYRISTTDAKYYVKGIRESGKDSILADADITSDADYVVAYGVMKNPVKYRVYYKDANGKDLLPPQDFWASVGDQPVVAYQDIGGYVPNARNEKKTMVQEDEVKENVFIFVYYPMPSSPGNVVTNEETETVTNTLTQIVPGEGAGAGAEGGGTLVVPGEGGDAGAGAGAGGEAAGEEGAGGVEVPEEPRELVDLDDEEVPLANVPGAAGNAAGSEQGSFFVNMPPAVIVGVVSMAVLVVAAAWYFLFMKKKRTNAGNEEK